MQGRLVLAQDDLACAERFTLRIALPQGLTIDIVVFFVIHRGSVSSRQPCYYECVLQETHEVLWPKLKWAQRPHDGGAMLRPVSQGQQTNRPGRSYWQGPRVTPDQGGQGIRTPTGDGDDTWHAPRHAYSNTPQGPTDSDVDGMDGPQYTAGLPGPPGKDGAPGVLGEGGAPGNAGPKGPQGPNGVHGVNGTDGQPGIDGSPGKNGGVGPPGTDDIDGSPGINGQNGGQGPPGADGIDGSPGTNGQNGGQGPPGADGIVGSPGTNGKNVGQGPPGADGIDGSPGTNGKNGGVGPPGVDGTPGINGTNGAAGTPGKDGTAGLNGTGSAANMLHKEIPVFLSISRSLRAITRTLPCASGTSEWLRHSAVLQYTCRHIDVNKTRFQTGLRLCFELRMKIGLFSHNHTASSLKPKAFLYGLWLHCRSMLWPHVRRDLIRPGHFSNSVSGSVHKWCYSDMCCC
jgi:hypothetical protein